MQQLKCRLRTRVKEIEKYINFLVLLSLPGCVKKINVFTRIWINLYFVNWTKTTYKDKTFQVIIFFRGQVSFIMKTQVRERWVLIIWEFGTNKEHISTISQRQHRAKQNNSWEHLLTAQFQAKAAGSSIPLFTVAWPGKAVAWLPTAWGTCSSQSTTSICSFAAAHR